MIIYYDYINKKAHFDIDDYVIYKKKPKWYTRLTPFWYGSKSMKEFVKNHWETIMRDRSARHHTVKTCPGFVTFFNKSFHLKIADDLFLETWEDGRWEWMSNDPHIVVDGHNAEEAPGYLSDNYIFIKFCFEIHILPSKDCDITYIDPVLYNPVPYTLCPGIIQAKKSVGVTQMNLICLFPKRNARYHFEPGTVLGAAQFSERITGFKEKDLSKQIKQHIFNAEVRNRNRVFLKK